MSPLVVTEDILGSRSKLGVLRQLRGVQVPLTTLEIARRSGFSQPAAAAALRDLYRHGLVNSTRAGQAWVHTLVRDNAYVEQVVEPVFAAEEAIPHDVVESIRDGLAAETLSLVLFGSWSRDEQDAESDIDVIAVASDDDRLVSLEDSIYRVARSTLRRYALHLSVLSYGPSDAAGMRARAPGLYSEIERDGVVLSGLPPWRWGELDGTQRHQESPPEGSAQGASEGD